jgi:hypothetical protein
VDEPAPLINCFCQSCRDRFRQWYGGDLAQASDVQRGEFRQRCLLDYVKAISDYCARVHPSLETTCVVKPAHRPHWGDVAGISALRTFGTDVYWVNNDKNVEEMRPLIREVADLCRKHGKVHQEWLQCWKAQRGREDRILQQGRILVEEKPDELYVWAWKGQIGTSESCDDPQQAWAKAEEVFRLAKGV